PLPLEPLTIQAVDRERLRDGLGGDGLQLRVEGVGGGVDRLEPLAVEPAGHAEPETEHRVGPGDGPVRLDVAGDVEIGARHRVTLRIDARRGSGTVAVSPAPGSRP